MTTLPYGTWPSPIAPESLATGQVRLEEVRVDGAATYWLEGRPGEGGRVVLVHPRGAVALRRGRAAGPSRLRRAGGPLPGRRAHERGRPPSTSEPWGSTGRPGPPERP